MPPQYLLQIDVTGAPARIPWKPGDDMLSLLHGTVGGWVARVRCSDSLLAWVDEEGLPKHLPCNDVASSMINDLTNHSRRFVGTTVFTGADPDGEPCLLTGQQLALLEDKAAEWRL